MRADAGDQAAAWRLTDQLIEQGRDREAAKHLVDLLAAQGRIDELRAEVDAGTYGAAEAWREAAALPSSATGGLHLGT